MNTVLMHVIMCLVCRFNFKAPGGGFRKLKFDLLYKYNLRLIYTYKACIFKNLKFPTGLGFRQN